MYEPNNEKLARLILHRRMALARALESRDVKWHAPTNSIAFRPAVTWGEVRAILNADVGGGRWDDEYVTHQDHFFQSNGKMIAPTWSIAPGPTQFGGSCVASDAYFHTDVVHTPSGEVAAEIKPGRKRNARRAVNAAEGQDEKTWVCNDCYALKGRYIFTSKILKWIAIMMWMKRVKVGFASAMIDMIRYNEARLLRVTEKPGFSRKAMHNTEWPHPFYFRVHDAGDFFSLRYFEAWCEIAEALPYIHFWANTRAWAVPKLASQFARVHVPDNFAVRASELFMNQPPSPHVWPPDASTMVLEKGSNVRLPPGAIMCPVARKKMATCQSSGGDVAYLGRRETDAHLPWVAGCRACWDAASTPIVYVEH